MLVSEKIYTLDEFDEYVAEHPNAILELMDGRIVEKVTTEEHGSIILRIGAALLTWQSQSQVKGHASTEPTLRLPDDDKNSRRPDVSFRLTDDSVSTASALYTMPDFAVEVKSRSNSYEELREKARFFLANGSRLVWLIYPSRRIVEVHYADGSSELFTEEHTLSGGDVLPGFAMAVAEIFA